MIPKEDMMMMKKMIAVMLMLMMLLGCAAAEAPDEIPGTQSDLYEEDAVSNGTATLTFRSNPTTGYEWSAFVLGGESVEIDETAGGYVPDDVP